MIEVVGDLWEFPADVRVITTNGTVKKNGGAVMGRGCALEAAKKWKNLPNVLGGFLARKGNCVHILTEIEAEIPLVSFPVKHEWHQHADPLLIVTSAIELHELAETHQGWDTIVLPRPGCGNGKLKWEDVRELLKPILDDRFHVITHA